MGYEFTRHKIAADRRKFATRWATILLTGVAGLALGIVANDTRTVFGILAASAIAVASSYCVFLVTA